MLCIPLLSGYRSGRGKPDTFWKLIFAVRLGGWREIGDFCDLTRKSGTAVFGEWLAEVERFLRTHFKGGGAVLSSVTALMNRHDKILPHI